MAVPPQGPPSFLPTVYRKFSETELGDANTRGWLSPLQHPGMNIRGGLGPSLLSYQAQLKPQG